LALVKMVLTCRPSAMVLVISNPLIILQIFRSWAGF